jgi:hypothetical protein
MSTSRAVRPTPPSRPSKTTRRLLKVASLGLAGFIAGLLSGCSASGLNLFHHTAADPTLTASRRVENLDVKPSPAFRHAPEPHYNQPAAASPRQANAMRTAAPPPTSDVLYNPDLAEVPGQ